MKNIGTKILKVMEAIKSVAKDGTNSFHKYKYATDAAIVGTIRKELIKNKLICIPKQLSCIVSGEMTTLEIEYTMLDIDSGEAIVTKVFGQGKDSGDKGVYKASTGGEKYFYLKTFAIPTDDDPENDRKGKFEGIVRAPAGYKALAATDPKAAQERIGEDFEVRSTPKGPYIFPKNANAVSSLPPREDALVTNEERLTLITLLKDKHVPQKLFLAHLKEKYGLDGTAGIKKRDYSDIYQWVILNENDIPERMEIGSDKHG